MSKRLTATEDLARDICWGGFSAPRKDSKSAYWKSMPQESRDMYCSQAAELIWWTQKLGAKRIDAAVQSVSKRQSKRNGRS